MYAVIKTGGRQYRAEEGTVLDVERLPVEEGDTVDLNEVLLVVPDEGSPTIGKPLIEGASVKATCIAQKRGQKINIWKYKPKKRYRRRQGHRQYYTRLRIDSISV
ncbi:MAG TPA: 50S ribosomal protein L21 [Aggregatilineales bacterium]|nr:50S ribosomal protein L21 [Aggregatilineales bacterium]